MLNETMVKMWISLINRGESIKSIAKLYKLPVGYIYECLQEANCSELLAKSRANEKKMREEAKDVQNQKNAIVLETGYMLSVGTKTTEEAIIKENEEVYIPFLCIKELKKLGRSCNEAEKLYTMLNTQQELKKTTFLNLKRKEELFEYSSYPVRSRSNGIVAVCVELVSRGYRKVTLFTCSREIERLAKLQNCGIATEWLEFRQAK